ncbi:MAG: AMP-binding protein, partial [Gammaproteobacteria bacterium]
MPLPRRPVFPYPHGVRYQSFWERAAGEPESPAVLFGERSLTRGELAARSNQVSHALRAHRFRRGDAVAVVMGNEVPFLEIAL